MLPLLIPPWPGLIARVRSLNAGSMAAGSIVRRTGSTSTSTGTASKYLTTSAVAAKVEEDVDYGGAHYALSTNRWADGSVGPMKVA